MNHLLIGISAALGVCVVALAVAVAVLRSRGRGRAEARVDEVVGVLERRMDELARELTATVARAEEESRRGRLLGEVGGSIDLEEVLERVLDAAALVPGADAALVRVESPGGEPTVAARGLVPERAARHALTGPPDDREVRSVELAYRYDDAAGSGEGGVHRGLAVPLPADGVRAGWLAVFSRDEGQRFDEEHVQRLEELAERAGPAIDNARRFREARLLADLDALTGLHNRRYFHETLAREVARAHRYSRRLALVVCDLDDFKEINDRIGHLGGDAVLAEAAERMREVVRSADVACRIGGDEFAVIVPESGEEQALQLVGRMQRAVSSRPLAQAGRVRLSAGVSELQPQDDAIALFERADERLYAAKAGKRTGGDAPAERSA